ncbi:MAG: DUF2231 domain-containing protein [Candidatus Omnitrophota bacterium]|nr:DUF2231 domain-containing protein [Candidatus Omnitrophota bacterium]
MPMTIHPVAVHFPIALFVAAAGVEIGSRIFKSDAWHRTAVHLFILGALTAPAAVFTGLGEEERLHLKHPLLEKHERLGFLTTGIGIGGLAVLWWLNRNRRPIFRVVFVFLVLAAAAAAVATGYFGGRMVYEYGVGVVH